MKNTVKKTMINVALATTLFTSVSTLTQVKADGIQESNQTEQVSSSPMNSSSQASYSGQAVQKKELSKSYIVFGSGLSQSQRQQVANVLVGNSNSENFTNLVANAQDYNQYINNGQQSNTTNASMISSVAIEPADPGSGIKVDIKDFDGENNITEVTQQQYAMAAQMAGVTDINIVVTAPSQVSGTSALTGVYEALAEDGIQLNNQNTSVANDVLGATQQATDGMSNKDKAGVIQATGQTAQQIAKDNQSGNPDSQQEIIDLLKKNLEKQGVTISDNKVNILANSLNGFKDAPVASTKTFTNGMSNTLDNIKDSVNGNMIKAKEWAKAHQNWFVRVWNNIKSWWNKNILHKDTVIIQNDDSKSNTTSEDNENSSSSQE